MPKSGQSRTLPATLRVIVAANIERLMTQKDIPSSAVLANLAKVGRKTVDRLRSAHRAAQLDTVEAVAKALNVEAWELLKDLKQDKAIMPRAHEAVGQSRQRQTSRVESHKTGK